MLVSPTPLLLILHVFLSIGSLCMAEEFRFEGFGGTGSRIFLNGDAQIEQNGVLRLTSDSPTILGHAFYEAPIRFKNSTNGKAFSFSTAFAFAIVPEYESLGGHGFAFTVSKSREMPGALPRQFLGLMNRTDSGNFSNHVFAVEFDTVQDFEFGDISDNHVGIDINSLVSNTSANASFSVQGNSREEGFHLQSGRVIQAWIDYDSSREELDVTLSVSSSKPSSPILSLPVDLSPIFLDYMYVGFSASTGLLASSHYVLGWSFSMNGETRSLDLSMLPSIPGLEQSRLGVTLGTSLSAGIVLVLAVLTTLYIVKKIRDRDVVEPWELEVGPHRFLYKELEIATQGFRDEELLGFGGFGSVYKGTLPNSNVDVAVKRINQKSKQGLREFVSEIESIGRLRHRNLVALRGWCRRGGDLLLVYDFMPNRSLDKYIFDEPKIVLTWEQRFKILKGVASALLYLHEGWEQTVIHRDIKAGNVLLDSEMNSRLGDFGLAKLYEHGENPSTTKVVGTLGYLAPELTKTRKPTTHSDVFAFGALLLETVCGRRPIEAKALPEELVLVDWLWEKWNQGRVLDVVDPRLNGLYDKLEVLVVIKLGLMCSNNNPAKRPSMRQVVTYLEGQVPVPGAVAAPDEFDGNDSERSSTSSYSEYNSEEDIDLEAGSTPMFSNKGDS